MAYGIAQCDCGSTMHGELLMDDECAIRYFCKACGSEWWREDFVHLDQLSFGDYIKRMKDEADAEAKIALLRLRYKKEKKKGVVGKCLAGLKRVANAVIR